MLINLYSWVLPLINLLGIMVSPDPPTNASSSISLMTNGNPLPQAEFQTAADMRKSSTISPLSDKYKNGSTAVPEINIQRSLAVKIVGCSFFSILAFTGITGNSLVIYAILTDNAVKTSTQLSNLGIFNLALTDLMTSSFVCFPAAVCYVFNYYPLGEIFCKIWSLFNLTGILATMAILAVISIDRFVAVGWSLHYPQYVTYNRLLLGLVLTWVNSFVYSGVWVLFPSEYDTITGVCDFTWIEFGPEVPAAFWYGAFGLTYCCLIPSCAILFCNLAIIEMSKDKGIVGKIKETEDGKDGAKQKAKTNSKLFKAMVIVILSYFILTFPVAIIRAIKVLSGSKGIAKYIPGIASFISTVLQFSASIVNPLIYGLFRRDFREAYERIFKKLTFRN